MRRLAVYAAVLAVLLVAWFVADRGRAPEPEAFHGTYLGDGMPAPAFTLRSADGPVALRDFRGQTVALFFGYASCPDFCPTTLAKLARVRDALGGKGEELRVVLVTVDPERDDAERLARYVANFDSSFVGLTGDLDTIRRVAMDYGIAFQKEEMPMDTAAMAGHEGHEGYLVNHGLYTQIVDEEGRIRLIWSADVTPARMEEDLRRLLR